MLLVGGSKKKKSVEREEHSRGTASVFVEKMIDMDVDVTNVIGSPLLWKKTALVPKSLVQKRACPSDLHSTPND